jgi:tripartite-type tricarboxylate transporter receptor subunit TctC
MNTFVVNPSLPVKSIAELVAHSKSRPGEVRYASSGTGGITHLAPALLQILTGADLSHVPYKSGAIAMNAIIAGEVQMGMLNLVNALPQVQAGRLRVLAVTGSSRSAAMPDVPTAAEGGAKGFDLRQFYAVAVPAGTPRALVQQLNREIVKIVASADTRAQLAQQAAEPMSSTPEAARAYVLAEQAKYAAIVKQIGLTQD